MSLAFSPTLFFPPVGSKTTLDTAAAAADSEQSEAQRTRLNQQQQQHPPPPPLGSSASFALDLCAPSSASLSLDCASIDSLADRLQSLRTRGEAAAAAAAGVASPPDAGQVSLLFGDRQWSAAHTRRAAIQSQRF